MAVWRTKAYDLFGFKPGEYSYARGKIDLFADLVEIAKSATREQDDATLDRVAEYVIWASKQNADGLASAVDLAFFLPLFRDQAIYDLFTDRMPADLLGSKRLLLMADSVSYNDTTDQTTDDGH